MSLAWSYLSDRRVDRYRFVEMLSPFTSSANKPRIFRLRLAVSSCQFLLSFSFIDSISIFSSFSLSEPLLLSHLG